MAEQAGWRTAAGGGRLLRGLDPRAPGPERGREPHAQCPARPDPRQSHRRSHGAARRSRSPAAASSADDLRLGYRLTRLQLSSARSRAHSLSARERTRADGLVERGALRSSGSLSCARCTRKARPVQRGRHRRRALAFEIDVQERNVRLFAVDQGQGLADRRCGAQRRAPAPTTSVSSSMASRNSSSTIRTRRPAKSAPLSTKDLFSPAMRPAQLRGNINSTRKPPGM